MTATGLSSSHPEPTTVLLSDGTTALLRPIEPADAHALVEFHRNLSQRTVIFRYFGPHPVLSDREVQHFTNVDGVDRVALVIERGGKLVAVARYDRGHGRDEAEVAFVVADDYQGKGIGTILLEHLVEAARRFGIHRFVAQTLSDNRRMLDVLRSAGFARTYERSQEVITVVLDISPSPEAMEAAHERDRIAVVRSIEKLLRPRSVAVVGAARQSGTIGHQLLRNLLSGDYGGPVFPVNPSATYVASIPCWPSVEAIPGPVDLALIAVPAARVEGVVEACGRKGVGALVVISAGFAETGPEGASHQAELTRLAHSYGMRIVGPNCFGVVNTEPDVSMNATFAPGTPVRGSLGFVSQSGGLGIALLREISARGLGVSAFVSTGNKADISGNDLLQWWEQDPETSVILMYLESFGNPIRFNRIARRISRTKPIVAVKSGRSAAGTRGAASHTAALASPEDAVDALFRKTGVIRVDTIEELFDLAGVLADAPLPAGGRVGIVTNAGGPGVLAADACVGQGLEVPELSEATRENLKSFSAQGAGLFNPVDMIASASGETYKRTMQLLIESGEIDALIVIFTPPLVTRADDVADAVQDVADEFAGTSNAKPILTCFLGADDQGERRAQKLSVPRFNYPETAARSLAKALAYSNWLKRPFPPPPHLADFDANRARRLIEETTQRAPGAERASAGHAHEPPPDHWVTGASAIALLDACGIATAPTIPVRTDKEAAEAAATLGFPVALKAAGEEVLHKTEVGGVHLDLTSSQAVRDAYLGMEKHLSGVMDGAIVQKMVPEAVETIAGFVRHTAFGPLMLFGLGGTAVEIIGDHATALAPLSEAEAMELVLSLRASALLTGFRGSAPVNMDALCDLLVRLSLLAEALPDLIEGDCNPVIASPEGAVVVDARVRVRVPAPS